jgi:uncharacterized protein YndB with AHSA1/START domain
MMDALIGDGMAAPAASERELALTRVLDAPRELVFELWTKMEHALHWWGPRGFTTVSCTMDVRSGGAWRRVLRAPDGSATIKFGSYCEIVPPELLVFTYADEDPVTGETGPKTMVTVTFADQGGKTRLTLRQKLFESVALRDSHQGGWAGALDRLAHYLETTTG